LELDSTVTLDDESQLIANIDGVLHRQRNTVSIHEVMHIASDIDFATGNIHFGGDVHIDGNVLDLFEIHADGDVAVHGLIEAACPSAARPPTT
jgi:hypothetical protein